jgi:Na+-translocating ferredoxin:NAD+ oxidoreductase RnfA subunit
MFLGTRLKDEVVELKLIVQQCSVSLYLSMSPYSLCGAAVGAHPLNNCLELSGITQSILYHHLAHVLVLVTILTFSSIREVNVAIANNPATVASKGNNVAFGIQEEEGLCRANRQARIRALAAGSNLGTNLVLEDLQ